MLRKLKNGFIGFFCVLWVSMVWLIATMEQSGGGAELNGILAFILWIVSIFFIFKVNSIASAIGSSLILIIIRIVRFGVDFSNFEISDELGRVIGIAVMCLVFGKLFFRFLDDLAKESDAREKRIKDAKNRGEACCPWCGSVSIQYYAMGIPYEGFGDSIERSHNKYHCNNCGREW